MSRRMPDTGAAKTGTLSIWIESGASRPGNGRPASSFLGPVDRMAAKRVDEGRAAGRRGKAGNAELYRDLSDLVRRRPSSSQAGMRERRAGLRGICARLDALGYKGLTPRGLGERHVKALVAD